MINKDLFIFKEDNEGGAFTDVTAASRDYLRDPVSLNFVANDKLYIGLYKPFNAAYVELVAEVVGVGVSYAYSDGSTFQPLEVTDDTKGFSRSGFIEWNRNIDGWEEQTVNGETLYWIQITFDASYGLDYEGFNIVFSSDYDMQVKNPFIMDYLAKDDNSFIRYHLAARNEIVQTLRNGGYLKMPKGIDDFFFQGSVSRENITKWDVLDFEEIREAATFRAMSMVFFNESRNDEDKAYLLYEDYLGKFGQSFKLFYLTLDKDDDGEVDNNEKLANNEVTVSYV